MLHIKRLDRKNVDILAVKYLCYKLTAELQQRYNDLFLLFCPFNQLLS